MMEKLEMMWKVVTLSVVVLLFLGVVPQSAAVSRPPSWETTRSWEDLNVGDVVAQGVRKDGACYFDIVRVLIQGSQGKKRSLDLRVDDTCQLKVNQKHEGPADITSHMNSPTYFSYKNDPSTGVKFVTLVSQKTIHASGWTYGYAGPSDKLTENDDYMTFQYDGSTASIVGTPSFTCWAGSSSLGVWVNYECYRDTYFPGPGTWVYYGNHGAYYCSGGTLCYPPPQYYHEIHVEADGASDGTATCGYSKTGSIPYGFTGSCNIT